MDKILSPFIFLIRIIFETGYNLTGNYGISILLLSFAISLLLLPIFIYIEKAKKSDDVIKKSMQPLIDEIKQVYTGQERYYYLKTLNRQFGYSQLKALIPILSLLVQIPFFIAAYQYLETLEVLKGVSFGLLSDLSEPDHLFGIVNILPVLMTVVNLLTAYFYTRNGNTSERKQMIVVAAVFLILLFKLPSGLVLYWTMNNVFAFLRLLVTNKEVFSRKIVLDTTKNENKIVQRSQFRTKLETELSQHWQSYLSIIIVSFIVMQIWSITIVSKDVHIIGKIVERVVIALCVSLVLGITNIYVSTIKNAIEKIPSAIIISLLFVSVYLYLASIFNYHGVSHEVASIALIPTIVLQVFCVIKAKQLSNIKFHHFIRFILLICIVVQLFHFVALENKQLLEMLNFEISKYNSKMQDVVLYGLLFAFILLPFVITSKSKTEKKPNIIAFLLSVIFLSGFILIWNPLTTFSTFPEAFQFGVESIINSGLTLMLQIILGALLIYAILPKSLRFYLSIITVMLVFISVIHSSIIPLNVGTLQGFSYSQSDELDTPSLEYLLEAFTIIALFFMARFFYRKSRIHNLNIFLLILNVIVISHAFYSIHSNDLHRGDKGDKIVSVSNNIDISNHRISLSKDQENVVVIMLDMIQGWYFQRYLNESQHNKNNFNGFTYYPNTVSSTNYTGGSMPGLIGGYDFAPLLLDCDTIHTLAQKMLMAAEGLRDKAQTNGYFYTCSNLPYCNIDTRTYNRYIPVWSDEWEPIKKVLNIGETQNIGVELLRYNALLFSSPLFLKPVIYNKGSWNIPQKGVNEHNDITRHYNSLRALPYITDNKSNNKTFTFMSYKATHFPWDMIDETGAFVPNVEPYANNKWGLDIVANWINALKSLDAYDNTRIVVASDHGLRHAKDTASVMYNHPYLNINYETVPWSDMLNFSSLLLVKDFSSTGAVRNDSTLMSTLDVQNIAFNGNSPLIIDSINNRTLDAVKISYKIKMHENTVYPITRRYKINQNIYDINNWTKIK